MNDSPFKNYGFNFLMDGKEHAFHVVAASADEAKRKVVAMRVAVFVGELKLHADPLDAPVQTRHASRAPENQQGG